MPGKLPTMAVLVSTTVTVLALVSARAQTSDNIIYLNQAWSQEDREWYYHFSQGSAVLAYDIYLNLEVAGSQDLFRSDANSVRYGLIPDPPTGTIPTDCRSGSARRPWPWLPGLDTVRRYESAWLPHDVFAGVVLATMLVQV